MYIVYRYVNVRHAERDTDDLCHNFHFGSISKAFCVFDTFYLLIGNKVQLSTLTKPLVIWKCVTRILGLLT